MKPRAGDIQWLRRAQPLLGTLVEVGIRTTSGERDAAFDAAFAQVREVQECLSRFEPDSDLSRFHALCGGARMTMRASTRTVLDAADELRAATAGAFDISLGSSPQGWRCAGDELHKLDDAVRLDLGGIGKGHAVDCAVQALLLHGCDAGWVNAGGDLRSFGDADVPVFLRDEATGGARRFASLRDGSFATSHFDHRSRSQLARSAGAHAAPAHVSVAAPRCLWADALTKIVAIAGDPDHALLTRYDAVAWIH